ncbi:MAG: hypothetical protein ACHREM_09085 [Polyangiales bacterium]
MSDHHFSKCDKIEPVQPFSSQADAQASMDAFVERLQDLLTEHKITNFVGAVCVSAHADDGRLTRSSNKIVARGSPDALVDLTLSIGTSVKAAAARVRAATGDQPVDGSEPQRASGTTDEATQAEGGEIDAKVYASEDEAKAALTAFGGELKGLVEKYGLCDIVNAASALAPDETGTPAPLGAYVSGMGHPCTLVALAAQALDVMNGRHTDAFGEGPKATAETPHQPH